MVVGTDVGKVHRLPEGQGLSEILDGNLAVNAGLSMAQRDLAARQKRAADIMAKKDAALTKLKALPDYWYKHNATLQDKFTEHVAKGVEMLSQGVDDPLTSTRPEAIEYQKEHMRLHQMAASSKQVQGLYEKTRADIDGSKADDYDPRDIIKMNEFFEQPLEAIVDGSALPPSLQKKKPFQETFQSMGKAMNEWERSRQNGAPTDDEVYDFAINTVLGNQDKEGAIASYSSRYAQMDPEEKKRVDDTAKAAHREPWQQMAYDDAKMYQRQKAPFDPLAGLKAGAGAVEAGSDTIAFSTPDRFSEATSLRDAQRNADIAASAMLAEDNRWMDYYNQEGKLPRHDDETDGAYRGRVKKQLAADVLSMSSINRKSGTTDKGQGKAERRASVETFIRDVRGSDPVASKGAVKWLIGGKIAGDITIQGAESAEPTWLSPEMNAGQRWLKMAISSPLATSEVEKKVDETIGAPTGGSEKDRAKVMDENGNKYLWVPIGTDAIANQTLTSLYDSRFKQTSENYEAQLTERMPATAEDYVKGKISVPLVPRANNGQFE